MNLDCGKQLSVKFPRPKEILELSYWNTSEDMVRKAHDDWAEGYDQVSKILISPIETIYLRKFATRTELQILVCPAVPVRTSTLTVWFLEVSKQTNKQKTKW